MAFKRSWAIQICLHCWDKVKGAAKFCKNCDTVVGRKKMDDANKANFKSELGIEYNCNFCGEI